PGGRARERQRQSGGREHEKTPTHGEKAAKSRRYTVPASGCGGIGRRARFRSVWGKPRGGSSPLIRIAVCPSFHRRDDEGQAVELLDPDALANVRSLLAVRIPELALDANPPVGTAARYDVCDLADHCLGSGLWSPA